MSSFTDGSCWVCVAFCLVFCRFFFGLSIFDLQLLIIPWHVQTFLKHVDTCFVKTVRNINIHKIHITCNCKCFFVSFDKTFEVHVEINCGLISKLNGYLTVFMKPVKNGELYVVYCLMYLATWV